MRTVRLTRFSAFTSFTQWSEHFCPVQSVTSTFNCLCARTWGWRLRNARVDTSAARRWLQTEPSAAGGEPTDTRRIKPSRKLGDRQHKKQKPTLSGPPQPPTWPPSLPARSPFRWKRSPRRICFTKIDETSLVFGPLLLPFCPFLHIPSRSWYEWAAGGPAGAIHRRFGWPKDSHGPPPSFYLCCSMEPLLIWKIPFSSSSFSAHSTPQMTCDVRSSPIDTQIANRTSAPLSIASFGAHCRR